MKNYLIKAVSKILSIMLCTLILSSIISMNLVNAEVKFPRATASKYINDYVGEIDADSAQYIMSVGKELEDKTGAEAIVVVIDTLQGESIESYANGIFREWGIGQKDKNNGLLILLSTTDRKWRVEVGTGLEGAITDIYSSRVMNEIAVPKFKQNQYGQGIREAYSVLSDNIAKEYAVTLDKNINVPQYTDSTKNSNAPKRGNGILIIGVILIMLLDFIFNRGRVTRFMIKVLFWSAIFGRGGRNGRNGGNGGGFGGFGGGSSSGGGSSGSF
ncbi:YgcG family protein [Clostridium sp.]|uniref:TPM domain-containing protein n=1 Tax=Clostridium sp. TaxID=1506 RepID=UPI001A5C1A36|nr:TPM domain-containing protein [Clostridium sp.]MBK5243084.1 TPM domain-containing protein [Clostridium sp.]